MLCMIMHYRCELYMDSFNLLKDFYVFEKLGFFNLWEFRELTCIASQVDT